MSTMHGRLIKLLMIVSVVGFIGAGLIVYRSPWVRPLLRQAAAPKQLPGRPVNPLPCLAPEARDSGTPLFTVAVDPVVLRELLSLGWYDKIDSVFRSHADRLPCDIHAEWNLMAAVEAFRGIDSVQGLVLDDWVERGPGSTNARLARAAYWSERAWRARGARWVRETRREQFRAMFESFERARADLDTVLETDPHSLAAYILLLDAALAESDHAGARAIVDRGLRAWPASFALRRAYIRTLIPRWGGSYAAMAAFAAEAQPHAAENPALTRLQGYASWAQGVDERDRGDTVGSVELFSTALAYGDFPPFLTDRAKSLSATGQLDAARADLDRAIVLWPQYADARRERGIVLYKRGERTRGVERAMLWRRALDDLHTATRLDPDDQYTREWAAYVAGALGS